MGHHRCCNKQHVRKGLWSPDEDQKLLNHIRTNGLGFWSSVPKHAGLERCGRSCKQRWKKCMKLMDHPMVIVPNIQVSHPVMIRNTQMINHPVTIPNSETNIPISTILNPPPTQPEPPIVIQGFDGPIETTFDPEIMSYNPNMVPIPPSVTVPPPDFNDLPSWPPSPHNSSLVEQNQFIDQDFMIDNYHLNSNPETMQTYNQDLAMLDASMPKMGSQTVYGVDVGLPFASAQEQFISPNFSPDPRFDHVHPNHINNIESLMTSFPSSTQYLTAFPNFASTSTASMPPAGLPCNGYFLGNPNGPSA